MDLSDLKNRLAGGRLFHAYIVTGGSPEGRERAGELIARAAVCSGAGAVPCGHCRDCVKALKRVHPDIEVVRREKDAREHTVDAMRAVRARASVMPNEAARSVFIIADADAMNAPAQNAMLKVFEEPPPHAVFVLLADNPQRLLPTVRSRCETVSLTPEAPEAGEEGEIAPAVLRAFVRRDNLSLAKALLQAEKLTRTELPAFIDGLRRRALAAAGAGELGPEDLRRLTEVLDRADEMAAVNVSAGHVSGLLLAELCRL